MSRYTTSLMQGLDCTLESWVVTLARHFTLLSITDLQILVAFIEQGFEQTEPY